MEQPTCLDHRGKLAVSRRRIARHRRAVHLPPHPSPKHARLASRSSSAILVFDPSATACPADSDRRHEHCTASRRGTDHHPIPRARPRSDRSRRRLKHLAPSGIRIPCTRASSYRSASTASRSRRTRCPRSSGTSQRTSAARSRVSREHSAEGSGMRLRREQADRSTRVGQRWTMRAAAPCGGLRTLGPTPSRCRGARTPLRTFRRHLVQSRPPRVASPAPDP